MFTQIFNFYPNCSLGVSAVTFVGSTACTIPKLFLPCLSDILTHSSSRVSAVALAGSTACAIPQIVFTLSFRHFKPIASLRVSVVAFVGSTACSNPKLFLPNHILTYFNSLVLPIVFLSCLSPPPVCPSKVGFDSLAKLGAGSLWRCSLYFFLPTLDSGHCTTPMDRHKYKKTYLTWSNVLG